MGARPKREPATTSPTLGEASHEAILFQARKCLRDQGLFATRAGHFQYIVATRAILHQIRTHPGLLAASFGFEPQVPILNDR